MEDFGEDAEGDFFGGGGTEVEAGGVFEAVYLLVGEVGFVEVLENGGGEFFAGDLGHVGGGGVQGGDEHVFVVVAVTGDNDRRVGIDR